jgi:hypothetical protein
MFTRVTKARMIEVDVAVLFADLRGHTVAAAPSCPRRSRRSSTSSTTNTHGPARAGTISTVASPPSAES